MNTVLASRPLDISTLNAVHSIESELFAMEFERKCILFESFQSIEAGNNKMQQLASSPVVLDFSKL